MIVKASSIAAPITSPVTPPSRRTQCRTRPTTTSTAPAAPMTELSNAESQQPGGQADDHQHGQPVDDRDHGRHRAGHRGAESMIASRRHAADAHHHQCRSGGADDQPGEQGSAQVGDHLAERRRLQTQGDHQSHHTHRPDVAAGHDRQRPGAVPTRPETVDRVGQSVQVHGPGAQRQRRHHRAADGRRRQITEIGEPADRSDRARQGQHRQWRDDHGLCRDRSIDLRKPTGGDDRQGPDGQPQGGERHHQSPAEAGSRSSRSATSANSSAAERSTGSAVSAPVPSPSRRSRSRIGSNPSFSSASC